MILIPLKVFLYCIIVILAVMLAMSLHGLYIEIVRLFEFRRVK